ncbi:hypothetical protein JCM11641_007226 [Rhodosporidiobolus odoratus]
MVQLNNTFEQLAKSDQPPAQKQSRARQKVSQSSTTPSTSLSTLPQSTHQLLSLLARLFIPLRISPSFTSHLQRVKGLLYDKDYLRAFGSEGEEGERWRQVYVARWTPARAVMYERVFEECGVAAVLGWAKNEIKEADTEEQELKRERERAKRRREWKKEGKSGAEIDALELELELAQGATLGQAQPREQPDEHHILMLGAGAGSEVVALGSCLGAAASSPTSSSTHRRPRIQVDVVDQGAWGGLLNQMMDGLKEEWPALSSSTFSSTTPTEHGTFGLAFKHTDVLATPPSSSDVETPAPVILLRPSTRLITIFYTISELLLQSRPSTLRLLSSFSTTSPGTFLLIVESASLALIPLGKEGRTYPLGTLLDHALCGAQGEGSWEKVKSEEAKWYRMPEGAEEVYNPVGSGERVKLENSRVVLRLYRRK